METYQRDCGTGNHFHMGLAGMVCRYITHAWNYLELVLCTCSLHLFSLLFSRSLFFSFFNFLLLFSVRLFVDDASSRRALAREMRDNTTGCSEFRVEGLGRGRLGYQVQALCLIFSPVHSTREFLLLLLWIVRVIVGRICIGNCYR